MVVFIVMYSKFITAIYYAYDWICVFVLRRKLLCKIYPGRYRDGWNTDPTFLMLEIDFAINKKKEWFFDWHIIPNLLFSVRYSNFLSGSRYFNNRLIPQAFLSLGYTPHWGSISIRFTVPNRYQMPSNVNQFSDVLQTIDDITNHPVLRYIIDKKKLVSSAEKYKHLFLIVSEREKFASE